MYDTVRVSSLGYVGYVVYCIVPALLVELSERYRYVLAEKKTTDAALPYGSLPGST